MIPTLDPAHRVRMAIHAPPKVLAVLRLLGLASGWVSFANHIKRLHDFGWSGWWLLAPVAPILAGVVTGLPIFLVRLRVIGVLVFGVAAVVTTMGGLILAAMKFFRRGVRA